MQSSTTPAPPHTPLRRISQGSLSRLSRSAAYPDAPHGLGFLEPALLELTDEIDALNAHVGGLRALGDALNTFNEGFASYLYAMEMNALTVDWPQAPTEASYALAARRAEQDAAAALAALQAAQAPPTPPHIASVSSPTPSTTVPEDTTRTEADDTPRASVPAPVKKGKAKLTQRERKERAILADQVAAVLPLEFRGSDPNLRRHLEMVVEGFLDRPERGVGILELVKLPDLNQARVNKCLIALVNRKIVRKDNSTGAVLYHWIGLAS
ncbi:hypothetical protein WOLCODRAFT_166566 [Wolfiporia cocos MD-104 SS10]|uniref:DASH complex subunit DAM1 n=1 Tax=Wolfiporia cocos (strain MD-104) TaxID=742152 RepID=A0A2H3JGW9_WOLCO|nr:hypothetical protein WOLCODRAFT_166566 [Wolfiporia cocos MD-104 SS10]